MQGLNNLTKSEQELLLEVPVMITFLVAGSDNNIDEQEKEWAEKLLEFRSANNEVFLVDYYHNVDKHWETQFSKYASQLADYNDASLRNKHISHELQKVNAILDKLQIQHATALYNSFRSFAVQIAKASGGLFGIGAISPEENKWVDLPMLQHPANK